MPNGSTNAYDVVIIGAGLAGIRALHAVRNELGLTAIAIERGSGVGGTWFWNRYPGAKADTDSIAYRYSFDRELFTTGDTDARYATQPQMLEYLNNIVDKHDLRDAILTDTVVTKATYRDDEDRWEITTGDGLTLHCRFVISAVGVLSAPQQPAIPGIERYRGTIVHTARWPADLDLTGRRVAVFGTGSSAVQMIPAIAGTVEQLTVLQRSAQYCVPAGDCRSGYYSRADYLEGFDEFWAGLKRSRIACGFQEASIPMAELTVEEAQERLEQSWNAGNGFHFMFGTFADMAFNPQSNAAASAFIKTKIGSIVADPDKAALLSPTQLYAKRPISADGYYESFNRDNVDLIDTGRRPVRSFSESGLRFEDGEEREFDVVVMATGFECVEGSYRTIEVTGVAGRTLGEHWGEAPRSYLGISMQSFPNFFMILGPSSAFSNLAPAIETQVEWIAALIAETRSRKATSIRVRPGMEDAWHRQCDEIAGHALFKQVKSWIFGQNIDGRPPRTLFYFGGLASYRGEMRRIADSGFEEYEFAQARVAPELTPVS